MTEPKTHNGITILGKLPDEPDDIPVTPPSGFIWLQGGTWHGNGYAYGIADGRVRVGSETVDFVLTLDDALALRDLLHHIIEAMDEGRDSMLEPKTLKSEVETVE
jgi:hypothetical protein